MKNRHEITRNGMKVVCFGEWKEDSNCVVVYDDKYENEFEEFYCDGGANWTEVVDKLTQWANKHGHVIYELNAC